MFSLLEFGERSGSGLNGIFKVWKHVFHTDAVITTQNEAVDRTTLTLSCGGNEQDVKAMLELYDHADELTFDADEEAWKKMMVEMNGRLEELKRSTREKTTQKTTQKGTGAIQKDGNTIQKTIQRDDLTIQDGVKTIQKDIQKLSDQQKAILEYLATHPTATREELKKNLANASMGGIIYNLTRLQELGLLKRVGGRKLGHWEVIG